MSASYANTPPVGAGLPDRLSLPSSRNSARQLPGMSDLVVTGYGIDPVRAENSNSPPEQQKAS